MRWFISDTHFGHEKVIEYSKRPFSSVEEMDQYMIRRWNETVAPDDELFFLGDFGLSNFDYLRGICNALHGNKILVRGNHDGSVSKMRRMGFSHVVEEAMIQVAGMNVMMVHNPSGYFGSHDTILMHGHVHEKGFKDIQDYMMCVCVELWDYRPVSEVQVAREISKWRNSDRFKGIVKTCLERKYE